MTRIRQLVTASLPFIVLTSGCALDSAPVRGEKQLGTSADPVWTPMHLPRQDAGTDAGEVVAVVDAAVPKMEQAHPPIDTGLDAAPQTSAPSQPTAAPKAPTPSQPQTPPTTSMQPTAAMPAQPPAAMQPPAGMQPAAAGSPARDAGPPVVMPPPPAAEPPRDAGMPKREEDPGDDEGAGADKTTRIPEQLVNAAAAVLNARKGKGQDTSKDEIQTWRKSARGAAALSPDLVIPMLRAIQQDAACTERAPDCQKMCQVIGSDCSSCAADATCRDLLGQVCGAVGACRATP